MTKTKTKTKIVKTHKPTPNGRVIRKVAKVELDTPTNFFKRNLRVEMDIRGVNQSDVARALWGAYVDTRGYEVARNRDRVSCYLRGKGYPTRLNLQRLADYFMTTPEELCPEAFDGTVELPVDDPFDLMASGAARGAVDSDVRDAHTHGDGCDYQSGMCVTKTDHPSFTRVQADLYLNPRDLASFMELFARLGHHLNA